MALYEYLDSRLVYGTILAGRVYVPRLSRCYFAVANPLEIRLLAKELLHHSQLRISEMIKAGRLEQADEESSGGQRLLLPNSGRKHRKGGRVGKHDSQIDRKERMPTSKYKLNPSIALDYGVVNIHREALMLFGDEMYRTSLVHHPGAGFRPVEPPLPQVDLSRKRLLVLQRHTTLYRAGNWRDWHDDIFSTICTALAMVFVNHTVVAIRSNDKNYENCLECLIWQFSQADIIVGAHGPSFNSLDPINVLKLSSILLKVPASRI